MFLGCAGGPGCLAVAGVVSNCLAFATAWDCLALGVGSDCLVLGAGSLPALGSDFGSVSGSGVGWDSLGFHIKVWGGLECMLRARN